MGQPDTQSNIVLQWCRIRRTLTQYSVGVLTGHVSNMSHSVPYFSHKTNQSVCEYRRYGHNSPLRLGVGQYGNRWNVFGWCCQIVG